MTNKANALDNTSAPGQNKNNRQGAPRPVHFELPRVLPTIEADFEKPFTVKEAAAGRDALAQRMPQYDFVDIDLPPDN